MNGGAVARSCLFAWVRNVKATTVECNKGCSSGWPRYCCTFMSEESEVAHREEGFRGRAFSSLYPLMNVTPIQSLHFLIQKLSIRPALSSRN